MRTRLIPFECDGLNLRAELVLPEDPHAVIVLCHGIPSGSPPDPSDTGYPGLARDIAARGHACAWFDFRGCRASPGNFSISGWTRDLHAMLDALDGFGDTGDLPRILAGSSAGGATAIRVGASRADVAGVATLAAPAAYDFGGLDAEPDVLLQRFRNVGIVRDPAFPADPRAWVAEFDREAAERFAAAVAPRPLLLIHGDADDVVGYEHAVRLSALACPPKELVRIPGGGHQLRRDPRAIDALIDWIDHFPAGFPTAV